MSTKRRRRINNLIGEEKGKGENNSGLKNREGDSNWAQINLKQGQ